MLHPSYTELIDVANKNVAEGEEPVITSRYSVILAAAKRARQIVDGADTEVQGSREKKPLSVAVEELAADQIHILRYEDAEEVAEEAAEEAVAEAEEVTEE